MMCKISRNKFLEIKCLFLVKKMRAAEVIIEDGSVGTTVDNGDLFANHHIVIEYSVLYQK